MKPLRRLLAGALVAVSCGCAAAPLDRPTGEPVGAGGAHQGLIGRWDGRYSNRYGFDRWDLTINEVTSAGRMSGSLYVGGECPHCKSDLAVTGMVSGPDGE